MVSARKNIRHRRRFRVTVGSTPIFTADIGAGGFSAELMRVQAPGTPITGAIRLNGVDVGYVGEIVWAKEGAPHISLRGRIGVRFIQLAPDVRRMLEAPALVGVS